MALSDLSVFSEWTYSAMTEVLDQQIGLFNTASRGTIILATAPKPGDYSDEASWQRLTGLVRRRDPYATGTVAPISLKHIVDTMVKIAAGTPPIEMDPAQFRWIQRSPEEAGAVVGQQLAKDTLADMLNVGLLATVGALSTIDDVTLDDSSARFEVSTFNDAQSLFGDAYLSLAAWVMHSSPLFDIFGAALTNTAELFSFDTINVRQDGFGRVFIITDSPSLIAAGSPSVYNTLGLVPGAIQINQQDDFDDNMLTTNGDENLQRTYQAEWSYMLGLKGFAWDKAHGGKAPTNAELATGSNWDKYVTSNKELAGVVVKTL